MKNVKQITIIFLIAILISTITGAEMSSVSAASAKVKKVSVTDSLTGKKKITLTVGKKATISTAVSVSPNKSKYKKVTYKSSNTKIAKISSKGVITAKKAGTCKITVTSKINRKKKAVISVKVVKGKVTKLSFGVSSKNMKVGEKTKLDYSIASKGSNVNRKIIWSSSNTAVASVNQSGVVTAKSAGTATVKITSTDGTKKTAKCKIVITNPVSSDKISYTLKSYDKGVVAIFKNNNTETVNLNATVVFYKNDQMVGSDDDCNYAFQGNTECALDFQPYDSDYNRVDFDNYKITYTVGEASSVISDVKNICKTSDCVNNVTAEITNNSSNNLEFIIISCVFYDLSGNVIGYDYQYASCTNAGSTGYLTFDFPFDENYDSIKPASYMLYVNCAYSYFY